MRNQKIRSKTKKRYILNPATVKAEIRKNPLLSKYLGHYNSSRVSGWGHTHGYIQVESKWIECNHISRTEYNDVCENVYTTKIKLYAEFEHAKYGWTEAHNEELKKIAGKYKIELS